ncbi:MAG: hypothetical protein HRU19_11005 [Pseudobacteriovorax sp.]|nr:hypothetical protein [Pseudobacteriovorax sp.]
MKQLKYLLVLLVFYNSVLFGKTLRVGADLDATRVIPTSQNFGESHFIRNLVMPPMIALDSRKNWVCILCVSIPTLENANLTISDRKKSAFKMRSKWKILDSLYWDDGTPVTGYDVKAALNRSLEMGGFNQEFIQIEVNEKDPRAFDIAFKTKRSDYFQFLAISLLPHKKPKYISRIESEEKNLTLLSKASGLYYGPYIITQSSSEKIVLSQNPQHRGPGNSFKQIEILQIGTRSQALSLMEKDKIDWIADGTFDFSASKRLIEEAGNTKWKVLSDASATMDILQINLKNPVLLDTNIRKAILLGIDHDRLLAESFYNYGEKPKFPPFLPNHKSAQPIPSDKEKSLSLLKSSGWSKDGNPDRESDLQFELAFLDRPLKRRIAKVIQRQLGDIGIKIMFRPYRSKKTFQEKIIAKGHYRDLALFSSKIYPGANLKVLFHRDYIPVQDNGFQGLNFGFWYNVPVSRVLDELETELDLNKRQQLYQQFAETFQAHIPMVPLIIRPKIDILNAKLVNIRHPGSLYHSSLFSSAWGIRKESEAVF